MTKSPYEPYYQKVLQSTLYKCRANNDTPREWRFTREMVIKLGKGDSLDFEIKVMGLPVDIIPDNNIGVLLCEGTKYDVSFGEH